MPIQVSWDSNAHTIARITFQRGWTWGDLHQAVKQADALIISQPHTVNLLIDIREAGGIPGDFITRAGELFAQGEARSNEGQKVVVGAGALIRMAYKGFLRVYGSRMEGRPFIFADSVEAARELLAHPSTA